MVQVRILSRSILGALRRSNVATSPASIHCPGPSSRPLWPSALERRVSPRFAAANQHMCHVSRFLHGSRNMASISRVEGEELDKPDKRPLNLSAKDFIISLEDERRARVDIISGDEGSKPDTTGGNAGCQLSNEDKEVCAAEIPGYPMDDVDPMDILSDSSHRDGSIYTDMLCWKTNFRIADRNETRREAMMFSDCTDRFIMNGTCRMHSTSDMLQIFSLKLANIPLEHGPVELYGYIAVRDNLDRLLNYVVNITRDDPIILEQGSLINMTGPKRGIQLIDTILIEYDMKIKTGRHEKEDLQLIDGVSLVDDIDTWSCVPFRCRMNGGFGGIDITASRLNRAVEATVEVAILQVQCGFSMRLGCFTSGLHEEIRLFDGAISESGGLKRSVVAAVMGAQMDLKFTVAADSCIPAEHCCSFKATKHGRVTEEIKTDFALIAVKVTWSTLD